MTHLVVFTEEPSAGDLLAGVLPRLLPVSWTLRCIPFEGKQDLVKRGPRMLRVWRRTPDTAFVVMRDQDTADCQRVKTNLVPLFAGSLRPLARVACRELEAWILGDLHSFAQEFAVPAAAKAAGKQKYSDPDLIDRPVDELRRCVPTYQQRDGSRRMGALLDWENNRSRSFRVFCQGIRTLTERA